MLREPHLVGALHSRHGCSSIRHLIARRRHTRTQLIKRGWAAASWVVPVAIESLSRVVITRTTAGETSCAIVTARSPYVINNGRRFVIFNPSSTTVHCRRVNIVEKATGTRHTQTTEHQGGGDPASAVSSLSHPRHIFRVYLQHLVGFIHYRAGLSLLILCEPLARGIYSYFLWLLFDDLRCSMCCLILGLSSANEPGFHAFRFVISGSFVQ